MPEPSSHELESSIAELKAYKERLTKEVIKIAQKLRMPQKKINSIIEEHAELNRINQLLLTLNDQLNANL